MEPMGVLVLGAYAFGVLIGIIIAVVSSRKNAVGDLRIDHSDPDDNPYLFLELEPGSDPNAIAKKKYITLRVKVENYISQK